MGKNQDIINSYFKAYSGRDFKALNEVMSPDVKWTFPGRHPFAGIKHGLDEVIAFFDAMGNIMSRSNPTIQKLIVAENNNHLVECIHSATNRKDGIHLEHEACVLWTIEKDKIISGKHFFADPESMDKYFSAVTAGMDCLPVIAETSVSAPVHEAWKALTDPAEMSAWYFNIRDFKPLPGFEFGFYGEKEGKKFPTSCKVLLATENKKLSYSWSYDDYPAPTIVTFELFEEGTGTLIRLAHRNIELIPPGNPELSKESHKQGWDHFITVSLKQYLEKRK